MKIFFVYLTLISLFSLSSYASNNCLNISGDYHVYSQSNSFAFQMSYQQNDCKIIKQSSLSFPKLNYNLRHQRKCLKRLDTKFCDVVRIKKESVEIKMYEIESKLLFGHNVITKDGDDLTSTLNLYDSLGEIIDTVEFYYEYQPK